MSHAQAREHQPGPRLLQWILLPAVLAALAAHPTPAGALPRQVQHEGLLLDEQGLPLEGAVTLHFSVYDLAVGGEALWQEDHQLDLLDGWYSVLLGSVTSLEGLFTGETRYLGIAVNDGPELTPRQTVASVPHALVADNAVGDITPRSITVGGTEVIDAGGNWVGPGGFGDQQELEALSTELTALQQRVTALENNQVIQLPGSILNPALSCKALKQQVPQAASGLYYINPFPDRPGEARRTWCNMSDNGGGWTLAAIMRGGSFCHISVNAVSSLESPTQDWCAKLSDEFVRALYTDQFWMSCGTVSPERFGRIDNIANFNSDPPTGNKTMTWSMSYGGATYSGTDHFCCNLGDHSYHSPHIIYSIAKSYPSYTSYSGCYNNNHGWNLNGFLYVR